MISRILRTKNYYNISIMYLFILVAGFYFLFLIFRYIISVFKSIFFQTSIEEELNNNFGDFPWTTYKKIISPIKRTITIDTSNEIEEFISPNNIEIIY